MTTRLTLARPDDWHLHLRDGATLESVVAASARDFHRCLIMPNLVPPVVTSTDAQAYKERILAAVARSGVDSDFTPMMTLYLTESTNPSDVVDAAATGLIQAVKLYPAGATTNSDSGVTSMDRVMPVLEAMAANDIVLCVHGEVTTPEVDIFDREARFIETVLHPLRQRLPELRVTLEHITTADGVQAVRDGDGQVAGSITPHHLMINRNHMLVGGIRPHYYCLPIVKREAHRQALVQAATSGEARFFLGTDSAPHARGAKESACGCAGVFNAPNTLSCVATVFEQAEALDKMEGFVSVHGARWYGHEVSDATITLERREDARSLDPCVALEQDDIQPFDPGVPLYWHVV